MQSFDTCKCQTQNSNVIENVYKYGHFDFFFLIPHNGDENR